MKNIAAVSGGVDSVVLLHQLMKSREEVVVAHVDHGFRSDSAADARFVEGLSKLYGCEFTTTKLDLSSESEASAREARWQFLDETKNTYGAQCIFTAHHQDDVIETMILNLQRGTHRHGLTSLKDSKGIRRPLLSYSKTQIYDYALEHGLEWVQDYTNYEDKYERNKVRKYIMPKIKNRGPWLDLYTKMMDLNAKLDAALAEHAKTFTDFDRHQCRVDRSIFNAHEYVLQLHIVAFLIQKVTESPPAYFREIEAACLAIKTANSSTVIQVRKDLHIQIERDHATLIAQ